LICVLHERRSPALEARIAAIAERYEPGDAAQAIVRLLVAVDRDARRP
jgi:hypothetical protein